MRALDLDAFAGHKVSGVPWDAGYEFSGKRVAVIGGGSDVVLIVPDLVQRVATLKVFQTEPVWVLPAAKRPSMLGPRDAHLRPAGGLLLNPILAWRARKHLEKQVKDTWLRRQLWPQQRLSRGRYIVRSSEFYPALLRDNCELVSWPIDRLCEEGVRTCDGLIHRFDCLFVLGS